MDNIVNWQAYFVELTFINPLFFQEGLIEIKEISSSRKSLFAASHYPLTIVIGDTFTVFLLLLLSFQNILLGFLI